MPVPQPMPALGAACALPPIYLIRHGETDWNRDGRLQGKRDIPLNAMGREQAAEAARRLAASLDDAALSSLAFVSSPLERARETMELLRAALGLIPEGYGTDARLAEISFGSWEGLTWAEVARIDPAGTGVRRRAVWTFVPPGGESYADVAARAEAWLATLAGPTVVVTHGGVIRTLMVLIAGTPPHEAAHVDIPQGRVWSLGRGPVVWR